MTGAGSLLSRSADDLSHALREVQRREICGCAAPPPPARQDAVGFHEVAQQLLEEERVPVGLAVQRRDQYGADVTSGEARQQLAAVVRGEPAEPVDPRHRGSRSKSATRSASGWSRRTSMSR